MPRSYHSYSRNTSARRHSSKSFLPFANVANISNASNVGNVSNVANVTNGENVLSPDDGSNSDESLSRRYSSEEEEQVGCSFNFKFTLKFNCYLPKHNSIFFI
jgi:hypothetical protein